MPPKPPATVYVVEAGRYAESWVDGVYATVEAAKAERPDDVWTYHEASGSWHNDKDWDNARTITPFDVLSSPVGDDHAP